MRRALILALGLLSALSLVLTWQHHAQILGWSMTMQREAQNGLARSLQALKTGNPGAWVKFLGLCLAYGFFHAVGPGHGKFLVGAYSSSRTVGVGRLAFATIAASLGQAVTAIVVVLAGIGLFSLSREQLTTLAETTFTQLSLFSIMLIGLWLILRGASRSAGLIASRAPLVRPVVAGDGSAHHHHQDNV
ncbi:hypothetical protein IB235_23515, partial [Paracoccus sp. PAR01]|nr:hypothetical protein [Paracoccus sp. PAR01]